jgi:hypothetical protein
MKASPKLMASRGNHLYPNRYLVCLLISSPEVLLLSPRNLELPVRLHWISLCIVFIRAVSLRILAQWGASKAGSPPSP